MKTIDEIFTLAEQTADKRKKVFNDLIEKTKAEILPKFCKVCESFDLQTVFFKTYHKIFCNQFKQKADFYDESSHYCLAINVSDCTISDTTFKDPGEGYISDNNYDKLEDITFKKNGILEFVEDIISRTEKYIEKYEKEIIKAENLKI